MKKYQFKILKKSFHASVLLFSVFAFTGSSTSTSPLKEFKQVVKRAGLVFKMPKNFQEYEIKDNPDLWYAFALKHKSEDFEVRYSIWPLADLLADYNKCKADSSCTMVPPNVVYKGRIGSNVLNMTGGVNAAIGHFPPQAVKKEFNADDGGSSFFKFNCKFGEGYKYGQMIFLHKDNVADVIITYLSNDKAKHTQYMQAAFHALRFK